MMAKQVSMPMKSASCNGPIGTLVPFFMIASMSSLAPTPVSKQMMASLMYGMRIRLARKPGESVDCEGILPMALQKAMAVSTVSWLVCRPVMISTPFCMGTGFMKCVEITRDDADVSVGSLVVAAAILVIDIDDVFVARTACGGQIWARFSKMDIFKDGISGTASITKSTSERGSIEVYVVSSDRILSDCSCVMRSFETSLASSLSVEASISWERKDMKK